MNRNKLRDLDARYVLALYGMGHTQQAIADEFGVSKPTIQSIVVGRTYQHVSRDGIPTRDDKPSVESFVRNALPQMVRDECYTEWPYGRAGGDNRPFVWMEEISAARYAWKMFHGRMNDGWLLHTCHNKDCWNHFHMEEGGDPVLNAQQCAEAGRNSQFVKTKDSCERGHPWTAANTYVRPDNGGRQCKECRKDRRRKADD